MKYCRCCSNIIPLNTGYDFCNKKCEEDRAREDIEDDIKAKNRQAKRIATVAIRKKMGIDRLKKPSKQAQASKLNKIHALAIIKGTCPGCLRDFSDFPRWVMLMCFEKAHYHHKKCQDRKDDDFFWACQDCNRKQHKRCGKFKDTKFEPFHATIQQ